jgi:hypothetical protein
MTSNGSANEAPRGTRAKELNSAETGGRNDIMTIILANGASYDFKHLLKNNAALVLPALFHFPVLFSAPRALPSF